MRELVIKRFQIEPLLGGGGGPRFILVRLVRSIFSTSAQGDIAHLGIVLPQCASHMFRIYNLKLRPWMRAHIDLFVTDCRVLPPMARLTRPNALHCVLSTRRTGVQCIWQASRLKAVLPLERSQRVALGSAPDNRRTRACAPSSSSNSSSGLGLESCLSLSHDSHHH